MFMNTYLRGYWSLPNTLLHSTIDSFTKFKRVHGVSTPLNSNIVLFFSTLPHNPVHNNVKKK